MGKTIARGEITIIDLIDTATYIYYSANADGSGATLTPEPSTKYIGIYSGPPVKGGQPNIPPTGTEWTKYVGEDGKDGKDGLPGAGFSRIITKLRRFPQNQWNQYNYYGHSENWSYQTDEDTPESNLSVNLHIKVGDTAYIAGVITDRNNLSCMLIGTVTSVTSGGVEMITTNFIVGEKGDKGEKGDNGEDANTYYIETNQEEILRFNSQGGYTYSPETFTFRIYNNPKQTNSEQLVLSDNSFKLEYNNGTGFQEIIDSEILRRGFVQSSDDSTQQVIDENTVYFNVSRFCANISSSTISNAQIFRFSYLKDNQIAAIKIFQMRNGISNEMAKFNAHVGGINASIQNNKLSFDANGLTLYENGNRAFWSEGGNLWLKGNLSAAGGTFSGKLNAATGSFSGMITANSGTIGGLTISDEALYQGEDINNSQLKIYGNGRIEAENIQLGDKATIKNSITLGTEGHKVYIRTPKEDNNYIFLESGKISLKSNGYLNIGDIELYGGDGSYGSAYLASGQEGASFWKIKDDGTAQFRELTVDKITVQNSVMEVGKVQAVGSIMFFKDSWKVTSVSDSTCSLDLTLYDSDGTLLSPPLEVGDYVLANGNDYYQVSEINTSTNKITFDRNCAFSKGDIITKIGKQNDYLITIQGDSKQNFGHSTPNSLTMSSILVETDASSSGRDIPGYEKKLVLGDLTGINPNYGTGLYAENVFLNGTLTTQVDNASYAGINTLNGAQASKFGENDKSKIVFWAGSTGTSNEDIQVAKFQITEAGSIYANQGLFEGSLITDSIIKGASIHTAKIYGEDTSGNKAALQIFDAARGIQFVNSESLEKIQLGIDSDGLYTNENSIFIDLKEGVKYFGQEATYLGETSAAFIRPEFIGFDSNIESTNPTWKIKNNLGFNFTNNENSIFEIKKDSVKSSQRVNFEQGIIFGVNNSSGSLDYQKTSEGYYNLYVR